MTFRVPAIASVHIRLRGSRVLARAEQPPHGASVLWRPNHQEAEGQGSGFAVYGRVVGVGPTAQVKIGDRLAWKHGHGPSVELVDGTHFAITEPGILCVWEKLHEHEWRYDRKLGLTMCDVPGHAEANDYILETRLPSCGHKADGPRVGWLEPDFYANVEPVPPSNVRPYDRSVSVVMDEPPMRDLEIWTPGTLAREGPSLGFVFYGRAVRVGAGANEPSLVRDSATGRMVRDGKQRGAPTVKRVIYTKDGPQVQLRTYPTKTDWIPMSTKPGERIVWAAGWESVTGHVLEEGILGTWTPAHACCVHVETGGGFACCTCGAACRWPDDDYCPLVAEAIIGRDPTNIVAFAGEPEPEESGLALTCEGEDDEPGNFTSRLTQQLFGDE